MRDNDRNDRSDRYLVDRERDQSRSRGRDRGRDDRNDRKSR